jgi:hypothetical protein
MINVALSTFEVKETVHVAKKALQSPQQFLDLLALLVTTFLCFRVDMGLGVLAGVVIARSLEIAALVGRKTGLAPSKSAGTFSPVG